MSSRRGVEGVGILTLQVGGKSSSLRIAIASKLEFPVGQLLRRNNADF
jgi:hypothetical protein